ncbi:MAG: histidine triad nucleotide-binding protein [Chloroflexi bacterium]|jgi:histidine triad (HIT) family protein|nr:histidine triad nucleotide-binding protein [Chloroflexota bacterium]MBT3670916.1 histidine triad nucleotide-binding protein [Chloroflexota bacterium]MBT4002745.1 histidine triad nucleotide-binding protein [Chloroflexota bacterium]MBT4306370.1 histidine triad nucleotide-binding protein [Chloroflexota bacterium]MBT4532749.1 histidine triad nucleotide-binding protein [Chloroflexota bacterium]
MENVDCIFCKIIKGDLPSDKVHEDDTIIAFRDINPVAPTHILIVPKKHITDNNDFYPEDEEIAGRMFSVVRELAKKEGITESGYRLIMNTGKDGGQEVPHMHLHLIGGQKMQHKIG